MRRDTFLEYLIENGVLPVALDKQPSGHLQAYMKKSTQKMKTCYSVPMQYSFTEAMKISHEAMKSNTVFTAETWEFQELCANWALGEIQD